MAASTFTYTYHNRDLPVDPLYQAYSPYGETSLDEIYQGIYRQVSQSLQDRPDSELRSGENYEFEWALTTVDNMIEFKSIQDRIIQYIKKENSLRLSTDFNNLCDRLKIDEETKGRIFPIVQRLDHSSWESITAELRSYLNETVLAELKEGFSFGKEIEVERSLYLVVSANKSLHESVRILISDPVHIKGVLSNLENLINLEEKISSMTKTRIYSTEEERKKSKDRPTAGLLNLKCRLSREKPSRGASELKADKEIISRFIDELGRSTTSPPINYRLINRLSIKREGRDEKVELSIVKSGRGAKKMLESPETYEVEIDVPPTSLESLDAHKTEVIEWLKAMGMSYPLTEAMRQMVKWDLYLMFANDSNFTSAKSTFLKTIHDKWFGDFVPNWKTLNNLRDLMSTVVNFEEEHLKKIYFSGKYMITEKIDGVRHWLYVNPVGDAFLIDINLQITQIAFHLDQFRYTLLDGELAVSNDGTNTFFIFDCMFIDGENVMSLPLLDPNASKLPNTRLGQAKLTEFAAYLRLKTEDFQFRIKTFDYLDKPDGMDETDVYERNVRTVRKVRDKDDNRFDRDGIIFTMYSPNYYETLKDGCFHQLSNIKWKPAAKLSADFLVEIRQDFSGNHVIVEKDGKRLKILELKCVNDKHQIATKAVVEWPLDIDGYLRCASPGGGVKGEIIYDQSVVECVYSSGGNTAAGTNEWVPYKIRPDKTVFRRPNHDNTVNGIIKAANYTSKTDIEPTLSSFPTKNPGMPNCSREPLPAGERDFYGRGNITGKYKKHYYRQFINLNNMVKFNVTRRAISYIRQNSAKDYSQINMLDLACGRANDYDVWNQLINVYGLDKDVANIETNIDNTGEDKRFHPHIKSGLKCEFHQMDLKEWKDDKNRSIVEGKIPKVDLVTCQFALHFFTDSRESFGKWLDLVDSRLNDGGILVVSTFDGSKIDSMLEKEVCVGLYEDQGQHDLLWQIVKRYKSRAVFGSQIDVTLVPLSDYATNKEYLVNLDRIDGESGLNDIMEQRGFKLVGEKRPFSEFNNRDEHNFYNDSGHTSSVDTWRSVTQSIKDINSHPNLKALADYHVILVYSKNDDLSPELLNKQAIIKGYQTVAPSERTGHKPRVTPKPKPKPKPKVTMKRKS
jgi:hypothetical protein